MPGYGCASAAGYVMVFSAVGPQTSVKSLRAMISQDIKQLAAIKVLLEDLGPSNHWRLSPSGYKCHMHSLGLGTWQMVAVAKDPALILQTSEEAIWRQLEVMKITTPRRRAWMGYLKQQLLQRSLLKSLYNQNLRAGYLTCTTEQVDEILSEGVAEGHLTIT